MKIQPRMNANFSEMKSGEWCNFFTQPLLGDLGAFAVYFPS